MANPAKTIRREMRRLLILATLALALALPTGVAHMAQAKLDAFATNTPGGMVSGQIRYNDANNRINQLIWDNQTTQDGVLDVFDDGVLVWTQTLTVGVGDETIPGNYRLVEVTEDGETYLDFPPNITYNFRWPAQ